MKDRTTTVPAAMTLQGRLTDEEVDTHLFALMQRVLAAFESSFHPPLGYILQSVSHSVGEGCPQGTTRLSVIITFRWREDV